MYVHVNDVEYRIKFHYRTLGKRDTICEFINVADEPDTAIGIAFCHPKTKTKQGDMFCKATGRKYALNDALKKKWPDNKEARRQVWQQYWNLVGG